MLLSWNNAGGPGGHCRPRVIGLFFCSAFFAFASFFGIAASEAPAPLPPPPELLDYLPADFDYETPKAAVDPEEARQALQTLPVVTVETPSPVVVSAPVPAPRPVATAPVIARPLVRRDPMTELTISPPSRTMPADYFNLPVDDMPMGSEGIPGVLMPEFDDAFAEPEALTRLAEPGMTIRQLEPYFALAKGSESTALEARRNGDESLFADQIRKSMDAYMAIIDMADASNEARDEAWYGIARCEYRLGNWWKAFDALERSFPKNFERGEVAGRIKLEMFIGERLWRIGAEPAPDAVRDAQPLNGYQAASRVYAAAIFNQPMANDAPLALLRQGDAEAMEGNWETAGKFYRQVIEYYPESEPAMQARSSLAESVYNQYGKELPEDGRKDLANIMDDVERAPQLSDEAEERRQKAVRVANDHEAEPKLRHAKDYLKNVRVKKSRDAAVFLLGDIVSHYPGTTYAEEAAGLLRDMGIEPPMVLSDGNRFPIRGGWSEDGGMAGGSIQLEGQDDIGGGALPPSPTRETVYGLPPVPGIVDAP